MKKIILLAASISILIIIGLGIYVLASRGIDTGPVACTLEAKVCPDGSAVGRQGPNCEFAPCPTATENSSIKGKVKIGPVCPVEDINDPCTTPPELYSARELVVYEANGTTEVKRVKINPDGSYSVKLKEGRYVLDMIKIGIDTSADLPKKFTLLDGQEFEFNISIDTGVR